MAFSNVPWVNQKTAWSTVVDFLPNKNLGFGSFIFGWVEVETTKYPKTP